MKKHLIAFLLIIAPAIFSYDQAAYCSLTRHCLGLDIPICPDSMKTPNPNITYDEEFCSIAQEIHERGLNPRQRFGILVNSYLGKRYRILYQVEGKLPITTDMMKYIMEELPFATYLVNAYQNTKYSMEYLSEDRNHFKGNNGNNLSGEFYKVNQIEDHKKTVYFGYGKAKVLFWTLVGEAVLLLDYEQTQDNSIKYNIRCYIFPATGMINSIMNMGMFRSVVLSKLSEIIADVEKSAIEFGKGNMRPIERSADFKTPAGQKYLEEFNKVIKDSKK
jgi:hypothetical protein